MKKSYQLWLLLSLLIACSCQQNNTPPNSSGSVLIKWSLTINGQTTNWQGNYPESSTNNTGGSLYTQSGGNGILSFLKDPSQGMFSVQLAKAGMSGTGTYNINSASFDPTANSFSINDFTNGVILTTQYGGNVNVSIQTFPNETVSTSISTSTLVKGTFSGTIGSSGGTLSNVSGSFESIRIN
jgi:hypothetical protein